MFVSVQQFGLIGIMYCSQVEPRVGKAASGGRLNTLRYQEKNFHLEVDRLCLVTGGAMAVVMGRLDSVT